MGEPAAAQQIRGCRRINVIGTSGSGKTTFARELARLLGLPCVEMGALFWKPGWRESSNEEFFPRVEEATSGERWVLDGNYSRTLPIKWKRVQLVVWLDPSFLRTIARVTARTIRRGLTRIARPGFLLPKVDYLVGDHDSREQPGAVQRADVLAAVLAHPVRAAGRAGRCGALSAAPDLIWLRP